MLNRGAWGAPLAALMICGCPAPDGGVPIDAGDGLDGTMLDAPVPALDGPRADGLVPDASCSGAAGCDDGVFCNGVEMCTAGACAAASAPPCAAADCDESMDTCPCTDPDADGDGADSMACGGTDCDDTNANRTPGRPEVCDVASLDEDCDPTTYGFRDADMDGEPDRACCNTALDGTSRCGTDCDDMRPSVSPRLVEACDSLDNDCDGATDEGVLGTFYADVDMDLHGSNDAAAEMRMACFAPPGFVTSNDDCDDGNPNAHTGTPEVCDSAVPPVDEDCDGLANPAADCDCTAGMMRACPLPGRCGTGTQTCVGGTWGACPIMPSMELIGDAIDQDCNGEELCFVDADGDGARTGATVVSSDEDCDDAGEARDIDPLGDCNDLDALRFPGATEIIANGIDEDCDGGEICYVDGDNDGFRSAGTVTSVNNSCADLGEALETDPTGDCNDMDATVRPGATEVAGNEIDEDCDGGETCWANRDGDGFRTTTTIASSDTDCRDASEAASGVPAGDCDDDSATIFPGASETIGDEIDQNCDGGETCYADADRDLYRGTATVASTNATCADPGEARASDPAGDCDDSNNSVSPSATEVAGNEIDEDCDGGELCYANADGDGFRTTTTRVSADPDCRDAMEAPSGTPAGDCDDASATIYPGAPEITGDGIDQDCNGGEVCRADGDGDTYAGAGTTISADPDCADAGEALASGATGDCNDASAVIHPGATELPGDEIDQDCDTDELCYLDDDNDGFRAGSATIASTDVDCSAPREATATDPTGDCDDSSATIRPGVAEITGDGVDQNCDGNETCWSDLDDDGYRTAAPLASMDGDCSDPMEAVTGDPTGDCNDTNDLVRPGVAELAGDQFDQNCDGAELCYVDVDDDGYRPGAATVVSPDLSCAAAGEALATDPSGDCNDTLATVNPGTAEICDGGMPPVDENCDGLANPPADCACSNGAMRACPLPGVCGTGTQTCVSGSWSACPIMPSTEVVGDGLDQDCNGGEICYADGDRDGVRTAATVVSADADCLDPGEARNTGPSADCDDNDATRFPGATETIGDGIDQNCDGGEICYVDGDNDGYRTTSTLTSANATCTDSGEAFASEPAGDCNDASAAIHPGPASGELAGDQVDQNCDGAELCYLDNDNDNYRPGTGLTTLASADVDCVDTREALSTDPTGDCNDSNALIRPGVAEIAGDAVDQNCDGGEVCVADGDNDGYSGSGTTISADIDCADAGENLTTDPAGDCNDSINPIHPGATEIAGDQIDQNCDSMELCYLDNDDDGYRPGTGTTTLASTDLDCLDAREARDTDPTNDCNDSNNLIKPGVLELTGDGIDQNCDTDETCWADIDDDGYRTSNTLFSGDTDCNDPDEALTTDPAGDCNDADVAIRPGVAELAGDQIDQNCDGAETCYLDNDNDGYRPNATSTLASTDADCADPREAVSGDPTTDCNDTTATGFPIHPFAAEIVGSGVDEDCNGGEICFVDADMDGYRTTASVASPDVVCATGLGEALASKSLDCVDTTAAIRPGTAEHCDTTDEDCDAFPRNGCPSATETLAAPVYGAYHGGGGGAVYTLACGAGEVLVGLQVWADTVVRAVQTLCQAVQIREEPGAPYYTYEMQPTGSTILGTIRGDPGALSAVYRICQIDAYGNRMMMTGIGGYSGTLLDRLEIQCGSRRWTQTTPVPWSGPNAGGSALLPANGGSGGSPFTDYCASPAEISLGIRVRAGTSIDAMAIGCSTFSYTPQ